MASDIRTSELNDPVDVAEYLFRRLYEVGVRAVHGVPGDYNLVCQANVIVQIARLTALRLHSTMFQRLA